MNLLKKKIIFKKNKRKKIIILDDIYLKFNFKHSFEKIDFKELNLYYFFHTIFYYLKSLNKHSLRESYKKVLNLDAKILKSFKDSDDFFEISRKLFFNKYAFGGKQNYEKIIENFTKPIDWSKASTNPNILLNLIKDKKQFSNITNNISNNIEEIF